MELNIPISPRQPKPLPFPLHVPSISIDSRSSLEGAIKRPLSADANRNKRTCSVPTRLPSLSSLNLPEFDATKLPPAQQTDAVATNILRPFPSTRKSSSASAIPLIARRRVASGPPSSQTASRRDSRAAPREVATRPFVFPTPSTHPLNNRICDCCGNHATRNGPRGKNTLCGCCGLSYLRKLKSIKPNATLTEQERAKLDEDFIRVRRSFMDHKRVKEGTTSLNMVEDDEEDVDVTEESILDDGHSPLYYPALPYGQPPPPISHQSEPAFAYFYGFDNQHSASTNTFGIPYYHSLEDIRGPTPVHSPSSSTSTASRAPESFQSAVTVDSGYGGLSESSSTLRAESSFGPVALDVQQAERSFASSRKSSLAFLCD